MGLCPLNVFQTYIKNFNRTQTAKNAIHFFSSSASIIISMFDLHTVHLKCFCSFMCPLNVFQTYIKNFNRKIFPGIC